MNRTEAQTAAKERLNAFRMADFRHMMGERDRPNPANYGLSGTTRQPGNTITFGEFCFHVEDIAPSTAPVHAGF